MNSTKERIAFLLQAYTDNRISKEELKELSEFAENRKSDPILNDLLADYWNQLQIIEDQEIAKEKVYNQIISHPSFKKNSQKVKILSLKNSKRFIAYAAAILVIISIGLTLFLNQKQVSVKPVIAVLQPKVNKGINVGSKKAVLTLADGSEIILQDSTSRAIAFQGHLRLDQKDGQLVYNQQNSFFPISDNSQNTVTTPKGGVYELVLHDGTKVWLNAASSLTYPVMFSGKERKVVVKGEAYFEVAKNAKMPFIVEANGSKVEVLGTHFNISAYADDSFIKTTLLEGAVKISKNAETTLLKPNQQAVINSSSDLIKVKTVDPEQAMAWKNGYFMFNSEDIKTIMKHVSRWYNVEVEYRGELSGKTFGGTISRFSNIKDLLKSIEITDAVHFEIEGRKVIVMP